MSDSSPMPAVQKGSKTDSLAIASLVLGIASPVIGIILMIIVSGLPLAMLAPLLPGSAAMVLGILSLRRFRRYGQTLRGMWMAVTGLVLGENAIMFFFIFPAAF